MNGDTYRIRARGLLVGAVCALSIAACGGGGGGGGDPKPNTHAPAVSGAAVKGVIRDGVVTAEEIDASGKVLRKVGSATTDATGGYRLTLGNGYAGGPVRLRVSINSLSRMRCDSPSFCMDAVSHTPVSRGGWFAPPLDFTMDALLPKAVAGEQISAAITPYTHMAARRAAEGSFSMGNIARANSEVSMLLGGVDILRTRAIDITDPDATRSAEPMQLFYSVMVAAVMGDSSDTSPADQWAARFAGGRIAKADFQELLAAAQAQGRRITTGRLSLMNLLLSGLESETALAGDTIDPQPGDTAAYAEITKVKEFVSDVRTWGTVIKAQAEAPASIFANQVDMAAELGKSFNEAVTLPVLEAVAKTALEGRVGALASYGPLTTPCGPTNFTAGTASLGPNGLTITNGVIDPCGQGNTVVNMTVSAPPVGTEVDAVEAKVSGTLSHRNADFYVTDGRVQIKLRGNYVVGSDIAPTFETTAWNFDLTLKQKAVDGVSNPVTFKGLLSYSDLSKFTDKGTFIGKVPVNAVLVGSASDAKGNRMEGSFAFHFSNASDYLLYDVNPGEQRAVGSYVVSETLDRDTFTASTDTRGGMSYSIIWDKNTGSVSHAATSACCSGETAIGGSSVTSLFEAMVMYGDDYVLRPVYASGVSVEGTGRFAVDAGGFDPFVYDGDGNRSGLKLTGTITGTMVEPWASDREGNWADGDVSFAFTEQLAGLPKAVVTVTADRTGLEMGTASFVLAYGSRRIEIVKPERADASMTITNQEGVRMVIAPFSGGKDPLHGAKILLNGVPYASLGTLNNRGLKVTYADGTFEVF